MAAENHVKMRLNKVVTASGLLDPAVFDISDESKVRIVVEGSNAGNTVVVRGRIKGQTNYVNLKTIVGSINEIVNVSTYDEIQLECTVYDPTALAIRVIASSFNEAGGSTDIDVPFGSNLTDVEILTYTSSDSSVEITGNNITKSIDLKVSPSFGGSYIDPFVIADWTGPSGGAYSLVYLQAIHTKGVNPTIDIYELIGLNYSPLDVSTVVDPSGNIEFNVPQTPDLRFNGLVIIK